MKGKKDSRVLLDSVCYKVIILSTLHCSKTLLYIIKLQASLLLKFKKIIYLNEKFLTTAKIQTIRHSVFVSSTAYLYLSSIRLYARVFVRHELIISNNKKQKYTVCDLGVAT